MRFELVFRVEKGQQVVPILRSLKGIYLSWENKPSKVNMEETEDKLIKNKLTMQRYLSLIC